MNGATARRAIEVGPDPMLAAAVVEGALKGGVASVQRFNDSTRPYIYQVTLTDDRVVIVRLASPEDRKLIRDGARLSDMLHPLGVPMPRILARDLTSHFSYLILEKISGRPLDTVLDQIPLPNLGALAGTMASIESCVATLPGSGRFGSAASAEQAPYIRWSDVIGQALVRDRQVLRDGNGGAETLIDEVEKRFTRYSRKLDEAAPIPFLPNIGLSHTMVSETGTLRGLVGIDALCWGDPRLAPARTAMALLNLGRPTSYAEAWLALSGARPDGCFWLYVATDCIRRLAAISQTKQTKGPARADRDRLEVILNCLLGRIDRDS